MPRIEDVNRNEPAMRATDPRPARTRTAILAAIVRLGEAGREPNIAEIAAEAGISRSSFYARFRDLDDVAIQLMRELYDEIEALDDRMRAEGSPMAATIATTRLLISEFERHRPLYAAVLGDGLSGEASRTIRGIFAGGALSTMLRVAPLGIDPEFAAEYAAAGILGAVTDWLHAERPRTPDELQRQILAMLPAWVSGDLPAPGPTEGETTR